MQQVKPPEPGKLGQRGKGVQREKPGFCVVPENGQRQERKQLIDQNGQDQPSCGNPAAGPARPGEEQDQCRRFRMVDRGVEYPFSDCGEPVKERACELNRVVLGQQGADKEEQQEQEL